MIVRADNKPTKALCLAGNPAMRYYRSDKTERVSSPPLQEWIFELNTHRAQNSARYNINESPVVTGTTAGVDFYLQE
jgi:hypothetical protein